MGRDFAENVLAFQPLKPFRRRIPYSGRLSPVCSRVHWTGTRLGMKYEIAGKVGAWLLVGTLLSAGPVAAQDRDRCEFRSEISAALSASASELLTVSAGSGSLVVEGRAGTSVVTVIATACASDERRLEELEVLLERRGSTVDVETFYPDNAWRGRSYAYIDLRVEVPMGMDAEIDDGSGSVSLSGLGDLTLDDGSGEIYVEDIRGSVDIDDGSGKIEIRDVQGDVFVDDGSGSIEIVGVAGSIRLEDGSGSIDIRDVGQDVIAYEIGSGTIEVMGVAGDFTVQDGRHDRIHYSDVRGVVDIPEPRRRRGDRR